MGGDGKIEIVRHQSVKLDTQQPALGQHPAALLDEVAEILFDSRVRNDHRFAKERAHLGAADVEHVAQPGDIRQGQVISLRHQAVAQTGPVQKQVQSQFMAGFTQGGQLRQRVERAQLRGIGDIHQLGLNHVLKAAVVAVSLHRLTHLCGGDFAVLRRKGQHLVARGLHSARLMDVDVSALGAQRPLMGPQSGGNDGHVGLGAPHQKVDSHVLPAAQSPDFRGGLSAILVLSIAGGLVKIGFRQRFQHLGMAAFGVIIVEIQHGLLPFYSQIFLFYTHCRPLSSGITRPQSA